MAELNIKDIAIHKGDFHLSVSEITIPAGKILGVMGKSGCGKSTLLHAVAGFEKLDSGEIKINGKDITGLPPEKRKVAIVFQKPALFSHLTVIQNICFGLKIQKLSSNEQYSRATYWLKRLDLEHLALRKPSELSGGEAQRISLIRAAIVGFPVLLLDEPFSALDLQSKTVCRKAVRDIVSELGLAAILVSHDIEDINSISDLFCELNAGKIEKVRAIQTK